MIFSNFFFESAKFIKHPPQQGVKGEQKRTSTIERGEPQPQRKSTQNKLQRKNSKRKLTH
jgi:hypothetical protein